MQPALQEPVKHGMMVFPRKIASALPLDKTRVNAHITGLISTVTVSQSFSNPFDASIELEYLFPLPDNAALVDFSIQIGQRLIRAELRENEQAQAAYDQAKQEGKQAAKLDQRRPNLFAVQIANVMPKHPIQVTICYENRLAIHAEELEFVFPMGLTPRYHSQSQSDEAKGVDSPVANPGERIGEVEISAIARLGQQTADPVSPSHKIAVENLGGSQFTINLEGRYFPDHDFVLRFPISHQTVKPAIWVTSDASGEIALLNCLPVVNNPVGLQTQPREFVFVLDRSGSMSGEPIRQARNALRACLRILEPQDTFRILLFDDRLEWYKSEPERVGQDEINRADVYLSSVEGRGGTEIIQAVEKVLDLPADAERMRYVLFLTDGAVSAEDRALQSIRRKLQQARIFTFGIGPSVNRALLSKMAQLGRGAAEFLQLNEDIEGAILRFQDKVAFPVLTDLKLKWTGCTAWDSIPSILPDLYAGQSLQLVTRLKRNPEGQPSILVFSGKRGGENVALEITIPVSESDMPEVKRAWARARIDELLEQAASGSALPHQVRQEIISLAIEHRLVTPFTAFIAMDPEVVNPKGEMLTVAVAQPLPQGLDWAGFIPTPAVRMTAASLHLPGMPKLAEFRRTPKEPSAREQAMDHGFYQQNLSSSENYSRDADILPAPAVYDQPMASPSTYDESKDPGEVLRWLVRTQNLDGSWSAEIEYTSAALIAFVRQGHTTRRGYYRKQVSRAAEWLLSASSAEAPTFFCAIALWELASADPDSQLRARIEILLSQLPPARTLLEQVVHDRINHPDKPIEGPQQITNLDDVRIACILKSDLAVPAQFIESNPQDLVRVWMAAMATH